MGEVWKARDTRLDRNVAVKISKVEFGERFEREARTVAALNHPHICQLYDVGPDYLVMELIEGAPLNSPLALKKAVEYAEQILDALDAAHRKGVIHRDLKPTNILVSNQGIKLLDFGLARQIEPLNDTDSTRTEGLTRDGEILGTLNYMAPEQLQGKSADARSDLFAFGCVLYEMLTGKRAFDGNSAVSVIAAILEREPAPLDINPPVERVVRKCLAKDPDQRFQNARDLKTALTWSIEEPFHAPRPASKRFWGIAAIAIASALAGWAVARRNARESPAMFGAVRFAITLPESSGSLLGRISPDGRWLAFTEFNKTGHRQLWVRSLDSLSARLLDGVDPQYETFWSFDSRFLAFVHRGKLQKIDPSAGAPQTIADAKVLLGGSWNRDGTIIFADPVSLFQVSANGGQVKPLTTLNSSRRETQHKTPFFLPDGRHFLYTIQSSKNENSGIYLGSIDSPDDRIRLLADDSKAEYVPSSATASGYLLFARGDVLMAQPFAADAMQFRGEAFPVVGRIAVGPFGASFSASQNGVLVLNSPPGLSQQLTWVDRNGKAVGTIGRAGLHLQPRISPNEKTVALDYFDPQTKEFGVWLAPVSGGVPSRFTFFDAVRPIWSPDGAQVAFASGVGEVTLYTKTLAGAEKEVPLLKLPGQIDPCDWSKDGRFLLYAHQNPESQSSDLSMLRVTEDRTPVPLLKTEANEGCGSFSPDGKWIVYSADNTGGNEIYVESFSEQGFRSGRKWQVSYNGGTWPMWSADGKEIFYLGNENRIIAVEVNTAATFQVRASKPLFATSIIDPFYRFDVTADGRRFLVKVATFEEQSTPPSVILNWARVKRE
jgi:Tol biopolymer transport system component